MNSSREKIISRVRAALAPIRKQAPVDMLAATQFAMTADWARVYFLSKLSPDFVDELYMVPIANEREVQKLLGESGTCAIVNAAQHAYGTVVHD